MVASVGSFFMSERVLKPKASVLTVLGLVLAYDLTTKTHDVSSLRVYRGKEYCSRLRLLDWTVDCSLLFFFAESNTTSIGLLKTYPIERFRRIFEFIN